MSPKEMAGDHIVKRDVDNNDVNEGAVADAVEERVDMDVEERDIKRRKTTTLFDNDTLREAVKMYLQDENRARRLYGNIINWNTSSVTNMSHMFSGATSFNQPLNWNTGSVTDMSHMFSGATSFNQPLNWK